MAELKKVEKVLNTSILSIHEVEEDAVIVNVNGWRMRVYFDKGANKEFYSLGKDIEFKHYGEAENPHEIKFEKLK